ncbi:MAG: methyltransferase domain-containing protein [Candidatus Latescibacteria bacterium]|nr:methyltransferase domain-containing protein [Candidatus Latescibacterota bacterium]
MDQSEKAWREFKQIKKTLRHSPAPQGEGFDEWTQEGVESLPQFFDGTAHVWDGVFGGTYRFLHESLAQQIPRTDEAIRILDIGCGTGLELAHIFARAPRARITGLDQAPRMLAELARKYQDRMDQIDLVEASCLDWPAGLAGFDFAVSILTMHHFPPRTKPGVYASIRSALGEGGVYIEADQSVPEEMERNNLKLFNHWIAPLPGGEKGEWNYDVRLSATTNCRLIQEGGFSSCQVAWDDGDGGADGHKIFVARP